MAGKIVLALSLLRGNTQYTYRCPDGTEQTGVQTNEAPVKYFLSRDGQISQILCLITPKARETALERFIKAVSETSPGAEIIYISIPNEGQISDAAMTELLSYLNSGDQVYLDSSGGNRYTAVALLQLARLLEYKGVKLEQVVYANISGDPPSLDDATALYRTMDLISGMQELSSFGSVDTLKAYYRGDTSPDGETVRHLLDAMETMTDAMTLCRLPALERAMESYRQAMAETRDIQNPLTRELLAIFREKFGERISIPWTIRWCLDHQRLPQALTLYREWMPKYILHESGLFKSVPELGSYQRRKKEGNPYQDENVFYWEEVRNRSRDFIRREKPIQYVLATWTYPEVYLAHFVSDFEWLKAAAWDMEYVQVLRNMVLHGNEKSQVDEALTQALEHRGYNVRYEEIRPAEVTEVVRRALDRAEAKQT